MCNQSSCIVIRLKWWCIRRFNCVKTKMHHMKRSMQRKARKTNLSLEMQDVCMLLSLKKILYLYNTISLYLYRVDEKWSAKFPNIIYDKHGYVTCIVYNGVVVVFEHFLCVCYVFVSCCCNATAEAHLLGICVSSICVWKSASHSAPKWFFWSCFAGFDVSLIFQSVFFSLPSGSSFSFGLSLVATFVFIVVRFKW